MTTAAQLVDETRRHLFSGQRELMNTLLNSQTNTDTTFTFAHDLGSLQAGTYLAIDLEILYVWSASTQGKTAVVQRGMLGSTAASHAAGALVYVNSKFPAFSIFQALNADLADLSSPSNGMFAVASKDITYNPAIQGYDLGVTTDVIDILSVRAAVVGPSNVWVPINSYKFEVAAETSKFASGFGIILYEAGEPGQIVRITYSAPFTPFTALTDNVTTTGLPLTAYDLPALGAGMRLTGVREIQRNFFESQGDTRRAAEVPPNAQLVGYTALLKERTRRIKAEADRLGSTWPFKRRGF